MGFKNLRLWPITAESDGTTGYPTYGAILKLQGNDDDANDFNAVKVSLTPIKKTKTLSADDLEKNFEKYVGYDIALEVFRAERQAIAPILGYTEYSSGTLKDIKEVVNSATKKKFGIFFEGATADGLVYQKYLYNVEFSEADFETETDTGEGAGTLKLVGRGYPIVEIAGGAEVKGYTVYEGSSAFVDGPAETIYKGIPA